MYTCLLCSGAGVNENMAHAFDWRLKFEKICFIVRRQHYLLCDLQQLFAVFLKLLRPNLERFLAVGRSLRNEYIKQLTVMVQVVSE